MIVDAGFIGNDGVYIENLIYIPQADIKEQNEILKQIAQECTNNVSNK